MANYVEQYRARLDAFLHEPGKVNDIMTAAEKKTGVKRIYVATSGLGVLALYLVFGYAAQLVCNLIGFVYPAYASVKAIESSRKDDDTKWLTYWVVFAYLSTLEFFSDILLSWVPFYWLAKCVLLVWCFAPVSWNGSNMIYHRAVRPLFLKHQSRFDSAIADVADKADTLANKAFDKVREVAADSVFKTD